MYRKVPGVRIPHSPHKKAQPFGWAFFMSKNLSAPTAETNFGHEKRRKSERFGFSMQGTPTGNSVANPVICLRQRRKQIFGHEKS